MRRIALLAATAAALLTGWPAMAEDRAVAVVEREYDKFGAAAAPDAEALFRALRQSGMRVASGTDLDARDLRVAMDDLSRPDPQPGARIVVLSGKFVASDSDTWLLARDAALPTLATADLYGMPLSRVTSLMRDGGSRAVLLLGDASGGVAQDARLRDGIGPVAAPGGVHVVAGPPAAVAAAASALSRPGTTVAAVLRADPALRLLHGGGEAAPLAGAGAQPVVVDPAPGQSAGQPVVARPPEPRRVLEGEAEAWLKAATRHSAAAYAEFLATFPEGRYADVARTRLTQLGGTPPPVVVAPPAASSVVAPPPAQPTTKPALPAARPAQPSDSAAALAEIRLNLSRSERAEIQRQLTALNYDTRGVDGIFGKATRAALSRWQGDNGRAATGYLDADTIARLKAQAAARARPATPPRQGARAQQRAKAWAQAQKADSIAGYNGFIAAYPGSDAAAEARRRVARLTAARAAAERETGLGLNKAARQIIEQRLAQSGLKVGKVDGGFDADTRRALRAFQQSRGLQSTGFVNEDTVARLLTEALARR